MKSTLLLAILFFFTISEASAQVLLPGGGLARRVFSGTDAPSACNIGDVFFDTDATAGQNIFGCTAANTWTLQSGSGVASHGSLTDLDVDDHDTVYVLYESSAGTPAAASCDRAGQIQFDTTNSKIYGCYAAGGNPVDPATQVDGYTQVQGDSGSATPSGSATLNIVTGAGLTSVAANGSPDTVTISIDNHVKPLWFGADDLYGDGTQCPSAPTAVTIASGPLIPTFICTDNDAASLYGSIKMPVAWNGGTVTFTHVYIQTAADTGVLNGDIACQARSNGEAPSSTWGSEVALDDAAVVGSNSNDMTTSAAATCAGTGVAGGDMLYFRYQLDATGTTTAVATLHHVGFMLNYTVTGAGSE